MQIRQDHLRSIDDFNAAKPSVESAGDPALVDGRPPRVGWFRFYFDDDRWEWSPEVQTMHGYLPGSVKPTTQLVLSHKHPDDYGPIADTLDEIRRTRRAFSSRHRIRDVQGREHHIVVVGDQLFGDDGSVIGTHGFYVDVTPSEQERQREMTAAITEIAENRAAIEQAKGMLMMAYGVDAHTAFELLRWRSQQTNVKLRLLAEQLATDFTALGGGENLGARSAYDSLLMTAHERVRSDLAS
jgi:ANTAR domain/PAS fold